MSEATAGAAGAAEPGRRGTVLVVDDCTTVRMRVREILEGADYRVLTASDGAGGLEEAQRVTPDAILVDFVMPRMNGYQFCQAVRNVPALRAVPVVLMSVKAERIGEQFVRHGLADDALSKPFQPQALLAALAHRVGRVSGRDARQALVDEPPLTTAVVAADPDVEARRKAERAIEAARSILLGRLLPAVSQALALGGTEEEQARVALLGALGENTLKELLPALSGLDPHGGLPSFSGSIQALPIGEVFQMIALQNLTGVMEIECPGLTARVFLSQGKIDLSRLDGGEGRFRLGNYLVQDDLVGPQEVDRLADGGESQGQPLGERLIKLGLISRDDLQRALQKQATDIFYEVLRWTRGVYRFVPNVRPAEASSAALAIPVSGLLMEGYRRVDEWRLVEREIRSFDEVYEQNPVTIASLEPGTLATDETLVLDQVNGVAPVAEVIRTLRQDPFEVCRVLYRLLSLKLIHRKRAPAENTGAALPPKDEDPFLGV